MRRCVVFVGTCVHAVLTAWGTEGPWGERRGFDSIVQSMMAGAREANAESADLMSYLLFDSSFTRALIDIGYRDAGRRIDEIEEFLCRPAVKPPAAKRAAAKRSAPYPKLVERPG